jgi:ubiquinone/menaquinone biosynthesis C-methylase UbiE
VTEDEASRGVAAGNAAEGQAEQARLDAAKNRVYWTRANAEYTGPTAAEKWAQPEISWGIWDKPEPELGVIGEVDGLDVVELGCGTAYFSAWLARRGARPVGVDITAAQLETARGLMGETGLEFPLVEADAGETDLPDASFDLAISEYGASMWVDARRWLPEAARLLRPGGRLVFMRGSTISILCSDDSDEHVHTELERPQAGLDRLPWADETVEFHLPHGELIDVLHECGFELERLVELYADADAVPHPRYDYVSVDWARTWPAEEIWVARKR